MEKYCIYLAAALLLILGFVDLWRNFILRNNTDYTIGEVVSVWQPNPEAVKRGNSKWAYFSYSGDGENYLSKNRIRMECVVLSAKHIIQSVKTALNIGV